MKALREIKAELTKIKQNVAAAKKDTAELTTKLKKVEDKTNEVDVRLRKNTDRL